MAGALGMTWREGSSPLARGLLGSSFRPWGLIGIIPARAGFTSSMVLSRARAWDHPRSRGVYGVRKLVGAWGPGSSPLARGLREVGDRGSVLHGIIPARAGFTRARERNRTAPPDHPRSRGVYHPLTHPHPRSTGSSPLARGLRTPRTNLGVPRRIIPARAGFTSFGSSRLVGRRDHPRSRGVYGAGGPAPGAGQGSSPLARGLPGGTGGGRPSPGIIPARAGFTGKATIRGLRRPDHPRSRGVYFLPSVPRLVRGGSSPLARGLRGAGRAGRPGARIIPARAGFTLGCRFRVREYGDHPRSRGVYLCAITLGKSGPGSSPLARGLRRLGPFRQVAARIIPARAGFTWRRSSCWSTASDHPRSRGVYSSSRSLSASSAGSSPLARGLRCNRLGVGVWAGIIPARAGFTRGGESSVFCVSGSSPLARGLPGQAEVERTIGRIIPARAGFTVFATHACTVNRDHPRSRGVYERRITSGLGGAGSSPLARGLLAADVIRVDAGGIIPARAGFTHLLGQVPHQDQGSSPLARGLRLPPAGGRHSRWIIPARAGFTTSGATAPPAAPGSSPLARGLPALSCPLSGSMGIIPARAGFTLLASPGRATAPDHPRSRGVYVTTPAP